MVTTDSVCDLPETLKKEFGISVCPYYICTEEGRFLDELEIGADELLEHISAGKTGYSQSPEVEDYERFFAQKLTEAQNIIHITMAKHVSQGYDNAIGAAKSFENVTVLDSGHLSSSMGLVVLYAAYLAENHAAKQEIVKTVKKIRNSISSAFIIDSTHMMCQAGYQKGYRFFVIRFFYILSLCSRRAGWWSAICWWGALPMLQEAMSARFL